MIVLKLGCMGCDATAVGTTLVRSETRLQDAAPDGWVLFDPYTSVTYCPMCWRGIEELTAERRERAMKEPS